MQHSDIAVIGGGPAGLSAALNGRIRNKSVRIFSGDYKESGLYKAEWLENILGTPGMTGAAYLESSREQAAAKGAEFVQGRVLSIMPMSGKFTISCGADIYTADAVVLATGIVQTTAFPGERELLGRGVSYCATCDGMLYRKKAVAVVIRSNEGIHEANYLQEIGCTVTVVSDGRNLGGLDSAVTVLEGKKIVVLGDGQVEGLSVGDQTVPCQGVFILRNTVAMSSLLSSLETDGGHIKVDRNMQTNIPGVYAAGDCIGRPYQVSKATGEGLVAALSAVEYLDKQKTGGAK
ncbi:MAG: NAD(P)/FAD-dependent oxidoreductase [Oscillospiraceae bacterium]|nr:NAD(P)/FAD-dependent oxidoreductase [Oscillospiraceae bacterium]